ncbi:hypothetical protein [Pseudorhodobacter wandonensis]|jgi:hypothetical protein|uniref:hypothetical protein n=1 Tax=Pseudorhodobacter wandonensis TaxID=1120568 RepID=UPI00067AB2E4|nr:hypothetical protein [Pseudorhodobacter wandonensis]
MTTENATTPKTISDLQTDATFLHAMAQGIDVLYDIIKTDLSPASNSMPAMLQSLIERADRLAQDLDRVKP